MSKINYVTCHDDIIANIKTLEGYLTSDNDVLIEYALDRIKAGHCFLVYKINNQYHFAPSRFLGYQKNSMEQHEMNRLKDGKKTNPVITKIVKHKLFFDDKLENEFINYCAKIGVKPHNIKRTYWQPKDNNININI